MSSTTAKGRTVLSATIDDSTAERLNYYSMATGIKAKELVDIALNYYFNALRNERSGGLTLTIPNPNNYYYPTAVYKRDAVRSLEDAAFLTGTNYGIDKIAEWAKQRLLLDSAEQQKEFKKNFRRDAYEQPVINHDEK